MATTTKTQQFAQAWSDAMADERWHELECLREFTKGEHNATVHWFDATSGEGMVKVEGLAGSVYMHFSAIKGVDKNGYSHPTEADQIKLASIEGIACTVTLWVCGSGQVVVESCELVTETEPSPAKAEEPTLSWKETEAQDRIIVESYRPMTGTVDSKGRVPGKNYFIWKWNGNETWRAHIQNTRDGIKHGRSTLGKEFGSLDEAKAYLESIARLPTRTTMKQA